MVSTPASYTHIAKASSPALLRHASPMLHLEMEGPYHLLSCFHIFIIHTRDARSSYSVLPNQGASPGPLKSFGRWRMVPALQLLWPWFQITLLSQVVNEELWGGKGITPLHTTFWQMSSESSFHDHTHRAWSAVLLRLEEWGHLSRLLKSVKSEALSTQTLKINTVLS